MKQPKLKVKYKSVMSFDMQNLLQKLISTPTSNKNASHINHIFQQLAKNGDKIREEFKEKILEKYATKDETGKVKVDEHGHFEPDPARLDEYQAAIKEFEANDAVVEWSPIRPSHLADIKITAKEIDLLGEIYVEEEGPGLPHLHSV